MIHRLDDQFASLVVEKLLMERTSEQDLAPPRMSHVFVDFHTVFQSCCQTSHVMQKAIATVQSDNSGLKAIYFFSIMYCCSLYRSNDANLPSGSVSVCSFPENDLLHRHYSRHPCNTGINSRPRRSLLVATGEVGGLQKKYRQHAAE